MTPSKVAPLPARSSTARFGSEIVPRSTVEPMGDARKTRSVEALGCGCFGETVPLCRFRGCGVADSSARSWSRLSMVACSVPQATSLIAHVLGHTTQIDWKFVMIGLIVSEFLTGCGGGAGVGGTIRQWRSSGCECMVCSVSCPDRRAHESVNRLCPQRHVLLTDVKVCTLERTSNSIDFDVDCLLVEIQSSRCIHGEKRVSMRSGRDLKQICDSVRVDVTTEG